VVILLLYEDVLGIIYTWLTPLELFNHHKGVIMTSRIRHVYMIAGWFIVLGLYTITLKTCVDSIPNKPAPALKTQLTYEQEQFKSFFQRHGSPAPDQMAVAVTATKRPALMAAIAVVESNGDPKAVGDRGTSKGAWQVQAKHWGEVPTDPVSQALQAERILEELLSSRRSLRSGLARYNGGGKPPRIS